MTKPISKKDRLKALEYVRFVTHIKNVNSGAIREQEFISEYEKRVVDELPSDDVKNVKTRCPKNHVLTEMKNIRGRPYNANCNNCTMKIGFSNKGFPHCSKCKYN